jgi:hypothetical protein
MVSANRPVVFLTGYGFEDRTIAVANYLKSSFKDKQKPFDFALSFGDSSSEIGKSKKWKENKFFLDEFLSRYSAKYIRVATTIRNPLEIYLQFRRILEQDKIEIQKSFTIVDITSFPKTTLLAIFYELLIRKTTGLIYYVEPKDYELPFSIGARYHGLLPFFGRSYNPNKKRILWVILGFEGHRAYATWNNVEPDETVTFIGRPYSDNARWQKTSRKENELLLQSPKVREDYISFVDVNEAISKLESLYSDYKEENIIIAPLGTKFSTLPVAYFAQKKDNVFVAFSSAERETEHQSIGSGTIVRCEFDESHVGTAERLQLS